ncbi:MAG TPA: alpha/beta hydrolase [Polyangiaceae bacterium]|jgi:pimeloyl-ACP methyl ester carboxylesterase
MSDGIVCDGFIYKYLWDDLANTVSVAHWNYRGHGRSALPVDQNRINVEAHGADLDAVRRHLGDPPVVLIGHSFGTQVALEAYRLRRERIVAMVLLCGSFGRVTHTFHGTDVLANVLPNLIEFVGRHPKLARGVWSRVPIRVAVRVAAMTGEIDPKLVALADMEPYFQHVAHVDFAMFLRMLSHAGEHNAEDLLPNIDVPVLVIAGDKDSFTPPAVSQAMAEAIPDAELVMLPGGTHVAPLEHHELVALRIEKFLGARGLIEVKRSQWPPPVAS